MIKIEINEPYKITYEGSYNDVQFELDVYNDGNYEINWMDRFDFDSNFDIEEEIYKHYIKEMKKGL